MPVLLTRLRWRGVPIQVTFRCRQPTSRESPIPVRQAPATLQRGRLHRERSKSEGCKH